MRESFWTESALTDRQQVVGVMEIPLLPGSCARSSDPHERRCADEKKFTRTASVDMITIQATSYALYLKVPTTSGKTDSDHKRPYRNRVSTCAARHKRLIDCRGFDLSPGTALPPRTSPKLDSWTSGLIIMNLLPSRILHSFTHHQFLRGRFLTEPWKQKIMHTVGEARVQLQKVKIQLCCRGKCLQAQDSPVVLQKLAKLSDRIVNIPVGLLRQDGIVDIPVVLLREDGIVDIPVVLLREGPILALVVTVMSPFFLELVSFSSPWQFSIIPHLILLVL